MTTGEHPWHREIGETFDCKIGGKPVTLTRIMGTYDYEQRGKSGTRTECPAPGCKGLGLPWGGLFHCEDGPHVAIIETGEVFALPDRVKP